jgi:hypothetical protein
MKNMKRLNLFLLGMMTCVAMMSQTRWCIVDNSSPDTPLTEMGQVAYLLSNDYNDSLAVVCKDGTLYAGLTGVAFRQFDLSSIQETKTVPASLFQLKSTAQTLILTGCQPQLTVTLHDMSGRTLKSLKTSEQQTEVPVSDLPPGIYLLTVGKTTLKVLKP